MSLLKDNFKALVGIVVVIIMTIVIANQPWLFLADVMQGKWFQEEKAHFSKTFLGNAITISTNIDLNKVTQIEMMVHYSPETLISTPSSAYELFTNNESPTRLKIILRPTIDYIPTNSVLVKIPYTGEPQVNITDIIVTMSDGQTSSFTIQS
jgi:hypothetical protein